MQTLQNTIHWMIDIETLDITDTAAVWEVAAVKFQIRPDWTIARQDLEVFHLSTREQVGRTENAETLKWMTEHPHIWMRYTDAQLGKLGPLCSSHQLFASLSNIIDRSDQVWCKGASFDFTILKHLFRGKVPWDFRNENCMRPIMRLATLKGWQQPPTLRLHDAAQDVDDQLVLLESALRYIAENMRLPDSHTAPPMFRSIRTAPHTEMAEQMRDAFPSDRTGE